ncbi:molybdate ABC transporter substrate-binding protein [Desulfuromonas acetoxidans]|uniref:Molybdenum ABC transporter, periplasmic molybdate-binding protein n=1 Tax=Desulfuromonas acetoxidans (strain DSM 684 / 11070) TaxID=281689 RepID=Q1K2L8_DESA6|nr:molybdate ABC transporter substrate-binding protein [Desulfuromonas acetoxidans]EAT16863.1 molybdenum ABC transporter, periplasmic molybdate-binding protein [Desulfuromonas acetoxidans DSM 684]MBF0645493.1 molybdate ABC transporter substrate-binding protein [Desulfuromonas acetoxidans]NVD23809.1 molybdate ABC transporter substrate-binding protein [Desulfuromonas acetoxidans]NVE15794.1 molybdate ABC transporter substrate-binding protein [Desulfuromonas acetoxidans]
MKKIYLILIFVLVANSGFAAELLVFSGAGMRVPMQELGKKFSDETGIDVAFDFDGSGRLGSKMLLGVKPDLFIPGSNKWAQRLKKEGLAEECVAIAYHIPVIITPKGSHKVQSLSDLTLPSVKLALGDLKAAAIGRNNKRLFEKVGLDPAAMNIVARGINVKQLVSWVETGSVDASIVWAADAFQSGQVETIAIPPDVNQIDTIPFCRLKSPGHPVEANLFWQYMLVEAPAVFSRHGFKAIKP